MFLDSYKNKIIQLCERYKVEHLFAFGSVITSKFSDNSDIDFLVNIKLKDPLKYAENYFDLKFQLEELLNRKIDLLEEKAMKNSYLKENIDNSKLLIYEA